VKAVVSAGANGNGHHAGGIRNRLKHTARVAASVCLQPDAQVLWIPGAVREGRRLLRELRHDVIVASGPPYSAFLVGSALSRKTGIPLVLDYRDEWGLANAYSENKRADRFSRWVQRRLERRVVRTAAALVATTEASARALDGVRSQARSGARVTHIYNGFDPDDIPRNGDAARKREERYRLVYVGTLWRLTSVAPLVAAVERFAQRDADSAARLELVFAGRSVGMQHDLIERLAGLPCRVVRHPYLPHRDAIDLMRSADGLCVLLSDEPGAERVMPAKVFEYMAANRPILAIAPPGEIWRLVEQHPLGNCFQPSEVEGIADWLARQVQGDEAAGGLRRQTTIACPYDRRAQAGQLAALLSSLVAADVDSTTRL
jgi:glycosyltransferase involved in cell wall biosynthesis